MSWVDDFRKTIETAGETVSKASTAITQLPEVPTKIIEAATDTSEKLNELVSDAGDFIAKAGAKAWDELTDEEKAIFEGLTWTAREIQKKAAEIAVTPEYVETLLKQIPTIEMPEIKLPEVPTPTDIINAIAQIFKPVVDLLNELLKYSRIMEIAWVPIYDPITGKTYTTFEEYITVVPQYLARLGWAAKQIRGR